mgnify:CR=1 FL=1
MNIEILYICLIYGKDIDMERVSVMIPEERVLERIREMAEQITEDYAGKELKLICILKGSVFFTTELAKRINLPVKLDFMSVSSYGDDTQSSGRVKIVKDLDESIRGQNVLVIEDIIDSGHTLSFLPASDSFLNISMLFSTESSAMNFSSGVFLR